MSRPRGRRTKVGIPPRLRISWKDWLGRMLMVSAGFIFMVLAVLGYFQVSGAWPAMKEVQFVVLPRYGAMVFHWSFYFIYWALWQTQNQMGFWWEVIPALALLFAWRRRELGRIAPGPASDTARRQRIAVADPYPSTRGEKQGHARLRAAMARDKICGSPHPALPTGACRRRESL